MSISASKIDWCQFVWNVVVGCNVGCEYCWARVACRRIGKRIGCKLCESFTPHVHPERMKVPGGRPKVIGVGLMTDLCGIAPDYWESQPYADYELLWSQLREQVVGHPEHVFVTPTKRPGNLPEIDWPKNWWVGATCTTQAEVDERVPALLRSGVKHPFLNLEPLCGPVDMRNITVEQRIDSNHLMLDALTGLSWCRKTCIGDPHAHRGDGGIEGVIVGGMSRQPGAPDPSPMHPDWVRDLRDQCEAAGVPFNFKQWGARTWHLSGIGADHEVVGPAPKEHPPLLDGRTHRELPGRWGELMEGTR